MVIVTRYQDFCLKCHKEIRKGVSARWNPKTHKTEHLFCKPFDINELLAKHDLTLES